MKYDAVIIGGGVIGGMTARLLSSYNIKICILEKSNDVATGASRANSAIIHAGFDAQPRSLKAKLNVKGSEMMESVANELGVKYKRNGSLVVGFNDDDKKAIEELYNRGIKNGVKKLSVIEQDELRSMEPNISDDAIIALSAETGAIICPYELTIAAIGNAMDNGAELKTNFEVVKIEKNTDSYTILSKSGESVEAEFVINAAGVHSDDIAKAVGISDFDIHARRGEYVLLDKSCGNLVSHTIFRTPSKMGKGILVSPTVDGNLLLGPTAEDIDVKDDTKTTSDGLNLVLSQCNETTKGINLRDTITSFCGLRAVGSTGDFIIKSNGEHFICAAGIESPGLSASPAIAEYILELMKNEGFSVEKKKDYNPIRKPSHYFRMSSMEEKNKIIAKDNTFGKIICRCEGITEGEIREAIRTNPPARDLDGVKRRTRAQMGRCQGGFCTPLIMDILAEELSIPYEEITKSGGDSKIIIGKSKEDI